MNRQRLYKAVLFVSLLMLAGVAVAGVYQSVKLAGTLPPLRLPAIEYLVALAEQGEYRTVIDQIETAKKIGIGEPDREAAADGILASIYDQLGEGSEAMKYYRSAIKANADDARLRYRFGQFLELGGSNDRAPAGDMEDAVEQYRIAIHLDPDFADAHLALARLLRETGRKEEAVRHYLEVVRLNPDSADAYFDLGVIYGERKNWRDAATAFEKVVAFRPDYGEAQFNLGRSLEAMKQWVAARKHYEQAVRLGPELIMARTSLARLLARQKQWALAEQHFREILRMQPDDAESHYNLGVVYFRQGKTLEAEEHFVQALRIRADFPEAQRFMERVRSVIDTPGDDAGPKQQ